MTDESLVLTVPEAGKLLGLNRNGAYLAAARGELPIIRIGRLLRVPKAALKRMLDKAEEATA
jgi:excisionase family DNA binding protein